MVCLLLATNNFLAPEMAKNSPIETRTSKMAYCSESLFPSSANCANRFQSIGCSSTESKCFNDAARRAIEVGPSD